jgi:hypothetical protein
MRITIYVHADLSRSILDNGAEGAKALGRLSQQAIATVQQYGKNITYAPVILPDGRGCAMSIKPNRSKDRLIVEIDPPGSALERIGVVRFCEKKKDEKIILYAKRKRR